MNALPVESTELSRPLLETRSLTKRFGDLVANDAVSLRVYPGEVHAILGENGAGKSTLMKMLYGFYQPTTGEILLNGQPTPIGSPLQGRHLGIGMVFQNFMLIPSMRVLENIALFLDDLGVVLRRRALEARVREVIERYHLHVNLSAYVGDLAIGEQQKVEILKLLLSNARILIFDEPTSVLAPQEVQGLFHVFARLKADGFAILFITHKLPEVMSTADRISVLRRGAVVGQMLRAEASPQAIVRLMLGSEEAPLLELGVPQPASLHDASRASSISPVVELERVTVADDYGGIGLSDVSFRLYPGEILGVAGVSGNGQDKLGDVILRLRALAGGSLKLFGRDASALSTRDVLAAGVACIPEDPLRMAAIPGMTVLESMVFGLQDVYARQGGLTMDWASATTDVQQRLNTAFVTSPPRLNAFVETLSGGNLQRVIIAREVGRQPQVLIAYYVVRGLDVSNARAAHHLLTEYRDKGTAILFISEDLDELFALSDRLLVMYHGKVVGLLDPATTTTEEVGRLMTGGEVDWP